MHETSCIRTNGHCRDEETMSNMRTAHMAMHYYGVNADIHCGQSL